MLDKKKYLTDTGANILRNFGLKRSKIPWNKSPQAFIPKLNKPTQMCTNLNGKPACLFLQVMKTAGMIITNRNGFEWTVLYMHKYGGIVGSEQ